jgi:hypothetical protein
VIDRLLPGLLVPNRGHPLNVGKLAWWLVLPHTSGGAKFVDILGKYHATLTNLNTSASGWRGATRQGGRGHLLLDGTDDYLTVPGSQVPFRLAGALTVAFWLRTTSGSVYVLSSASNQAGWMVSIGIFTVANKIHLWSGSAAVNGLTNVNDGNWHRILISHPAGGPTRIYLDGNNDTSGAGTQADMGAPTGDIFLGQRGNASGFLAGSLDDVAIWSGRALSAAEAAEENALARRGYPGMLIRTGAPLAPPPVGGPVPWHLFFGRSA